MPLLDRLVQQAHQQGASDLHLEPGLPAAARVDGRLRVLGEPIGGQALLGEARRLLTGDRWRDFTVRRSADLSRTVSRVRCRINVLHSSRGVGFAIRLLAPFQATLDSLNLHPDLGALAHKPHGLVLLSGPTGSGKSSTMAALIHEINRSEARHIVTLEQPIEHLHRPRKAYIRQREVGRDTPSFEQGVLDALREDPDVILVGEMRHPETMRLTLTAAETGHLVFATVHSSSTAEALARITNAFQPEMQSAVSAQLADALVAVVCQRLVFRRSPGIRVPELEILVASDPIRAAIRSGGLHKLRSMLQTGAADGSWTFERYRRWLDDRRRFFIPRSDAGEPLPEDQEPAAAAPRAPTPPAGVAPPSPTPSPTGSSTGQRSDDGVLVLDGHNDSLESILSEL